jgi:hypothetical protein
MFGGPQGMVDLKKMPFKMMNGSLKVSRPLTGIEYAFKPLMIPVNVLQGGEKAIQVSGIESPVNEFPNVTRSVLHHEIIRRIAHQRHHFCRVIDDHFAVSPGDGGR